MAADVQGIVTKPGRVGVPEFEASVVQQMALLIKENPTIVRSGDHSMLQRMRNLSIRLLNKIGFSIATPTPHQPTFATLEIELDAHGGSGRAGYIKLIGHDGKPVWVNSKGVGITGLGNTAGMRVGPPIGDRISHQDGSAYIIEGLAEAANSRLASNELKYGASRVIGLIGTNMMIRFPDGSQHPLLVIVRAPTRRLDPKFHETILDFRLL